MGSGSSKAKSLVARETPDLSPRRPVANVNKPELSSPTTERAAINSVESNIKNNSDDIYVVEKQRKDDERVSKLSAYVNKQSGVEKKNIISGYNYNINESPSVLQFDDDSDYNDDIDKILEIPVAVDKAKQGGNKHKKIKQVQTNKIIGNSNMHDVNNTSVAGYTEARLPETYAQRLQRQQYTHQQNVPLHEKNIVKGLPEWRQESDDEEDVDRVTSQRAFDASKFRAVNRGSVFKGNVIASDSQEFKTQPDLTPSTGHYLDDLVVKTQENVSMIKQLPQYNQSELDLMRQLEDGLL